MNSTLAVDPYRLNTNPAEFDLNAVHAFISQTYWAQGMPRDVFERAVANSRCIGLFAGEHQIGFARAVTDRATFAYLADVYVLEAHRGLGLARRMVQALLDHPDLQGLRRTLLATRDAHGLYERLGFRPLAAPDRMMEILRPNVYGVSR